MLSGEDYAEKLAALENGLKEHGDKLTESEKKLIEEKFIPLKQLLQESIAAQKANMAYIYSEDLLADFGDWIRQVGLRRISDSLDNHNAWGNVGFRIIKNGEDEADWGLEFKGLMLS